MRNFVKRLLLKLRIIKRKKLSEEDKKSQMNNFYNINPDYNFKKQLKDKFGLTAWRKSLISKIRIGSKFNFLDLGCGLGVNSYQIINDYKGNIKKGFLIDFSDSSHKFLNKIFSSYKNIFLINDYAINALELIEDNSINLVTIFGFLHEIENRKDLLYLLRTKLSEKYLVLFSDNCLYFKAREIHDDFIKAGFKGSTYEKKFSMLFMHLFKKQDYVKDIKSYKLVFKLGSADSIIGIYRSDILIQTKHSFFD